MRRPKLDIRVAPDHNSTSDLREWGKKCMKSTIPFLDFTQGVRYPSNFGTDTSVVTILAQECSIYMKFIMKFSRRWNEKNCLNT